MSKYNSTSSVPRTATINEAGGKAFTQSTKLAIASFLFTSFLTDTYYRTEDQEMKRLEKLFAEEKDKEFIAKAALYTRNEYGMRSVSHLAAAMLAKDLSGNPKAKSFFEKIVRRPDDMMEILACYAGRNGMDAKHLRKIPASMKKGFASAIQRMDAYQLAKYRKEGSEISMVDIFNLVHPRPTEKNAEAFSALMKGTLKNTKTWEAKQSKAGQEAKTEKEKKEKKAQAWKEMLLDGSIGYDALLMNLRNIAETENKSIIDQAIKLVTDQKRIDKSLTMPFKYYVAYKNVVNSNRRLGNAVSKALNMCLKNIPKLSGETLVMLDTSGSMTSSRVAKSDISVAEAGALFAIALNKAMDADVRWFHTGSGEVILNPEDSITTGMSKFNFNGGDTLLGEALIKLSREKKKYDNIIVISDMQCYEHSGWRSSMSSNEALKCYRRETGVKPTIFSLDLRGSGTMQFPENNVVFMAGFSDKIFSSMEEIVKGPSKLLSMIEAVEF